MIKRKLPEGKLCRPEHVLDVTRAAYNSYNPAKPDCFQAPSLIAHPPVLPFFPELQLACCLLLVSSRLPVHASFFYATFSPHMEVKCLRVGSLSRASKKATTSCSSTKDRTSRVVKPLIPLTAITVLHMHAHTLLAF